MYAELKCKTNFSFLRGASHPDELVRRAHELGLVGLAIADRNGVYGVPKAHWIAKNLMGFKLIVGAELQMADHSPITLLAKDRAAYGLLCRMLTQSHAGKEKGLASLTISELCEFMGRSAGKNLMCLPEAMGAKESNSNYELLKELFEKNIHLPLGRFHDGYDKDRTERALQISKSFSIPIVATNEVLYHEKRRRPLHDALTSIREGVSLPALGYKGQSNSERHLKSPFEMQLLFQDMPEAVWRTVEIADSCVFSMAELRYRYPSEWIPENHTAQSYLEKLTNEGAKERYGDCVPLAVQAQLQHEFSLIQKLQFADYFLTIYDIVDFANSRDILCQGRGSAANSVVCYCLGITAIDPIQMNLLFERFISVERNEPPDIDVDFEHERREEVIQYIYEKYGRDRAAMVSAVVTYQKRSAFRELAKAFAIDVGTLSAKKLLKNFAQYEKQSSIPNCRQKIEELASEMATFPRHISIHSGGFTLSADPIVEIVPVEPARMEGRTIIQWDKYDLDYLGLLKIDVLALGMLSAIQKTLKLSGMKLHQIPHGDKETYEMIQKADTVGTFQVESRAQMNMSGRLRPRTFYDLVVQVAIVRPGPIVGDMVHPYLRRRQGLEKIVYPHPKLKEILGKTLGIPLFQEQLMKIAIELGEFTPGESDYLRRAIGAWRASGSIRNVGEKLLQGLLKNGVPEDYAFKLLEHMKGFAHYGFPESHAASFALLTYASCYLKKHRQLEFTCGLLNSWPMGFYHPHSLIDDAKRHGVEVLPVDPNASDWDCTVVRSEVGGFVMRRLRLGLRMVHGLSKKEAATIVQNQPYESLGDFLNRTKLKNDVLYRLAMGDALRCFGVDQRQTLWKILEQKVRASDQQLDLFSQHYACEARSEGETKGSGENSAFRKLSEFDEVQHQYEAFGVSDKGHPMQALRKIKNLPRLTTHQVKRTPPKTFVRTAGLLLVRQKPPTANGVCFAAIEDEFGFLDMVIFKKEFEKFKDIFLYQCFLKVGGYVERDGHSVSMIVKSVAPILGAETQKSNGFAIEPTQYFW